MKLNVSPLVAQICVDVTKVKEQVIFEGPQRPPYQIKCPLEPVESSGPPLLQLAWQKDCQQLHAQKGKSYLEFANISLEDQGNYTCMHQGNNTVSFTVRLIVKGTYNFK